VAPSGSTVARDEVVTSLLAKSSIVSAGSDAERSIAPQQAQRGLKAELGAPHDAHFSEVALDVTLRPPACPSP
jgi:hypothetical protein